MVDAELPCDGTGSDAVIAGDHGHLEPQAVKVRYRLSCGRLDWIRDGDCCSDLPVNSGIERCSAFFPKRRAVILKLPNIHLLALH